MITLRETFRQQWKNLLYIPPFYLLCRTGYVWTKLAWSCSEGEWPIVRFLLISGIITFAPGLFMLRLFRIQCLAWTTRLLLIVSTSLAFSALLFWHLYLLGVYNPVVTVIALLVLAIGGVYGTRSVSVARLAQQFHSRLLALSAFDYVSLLVGGLVLQGVFEANVGTPMTAWDAIVSWDKWAIDMASRHELGQYLMGGYPQFVPTIHSIFYKAAGTAGNIFPVEHLMLHGFCVSYVALLVLSVMCLGRSLHVPGLLVLLLFLLNRDVFSYLSNGYVDIPLAASVSTACALIIAYYRGEWQAVCGRYSNSVIIFLTLFSMAFIKGNGLAWVVLLFAFLLFLSWRTSRQKMVLLAALLTGLSVVPYYLHQIYYSCHVALAERSPYLHSFTVRMAHTSLFSPSVKHAESLIVRLMGNYGIAASLAPWIFGVCVCFWMWALCRRRLAFFAWSGGGMLALWFISGSYDFRNAFAPLLLLTFAVVGSCFDVAQRKIGNGACLSLFGLIVVFWGCYSNKGLVFYALTQPTRPYSVPQAIEMRPGERHRAMRPWGDVRTLFFDTPYGQRAAHLWSGTGLYRLLAPRGVYAMNFNSFNGVQPHDLIVKETYMNAPKDSLPIATLRRIEKGQTIWIHKPELRPVAYEVVPIDSINGGIVVSNDIVHLRANAIYELRLQKRDQQGEEYIAKDGIIAVQVLPEGSQLKMVLHPEDERRDPYSAYFAAVSDGEWIRLLYWMREKGPAWPRLLLKVGTQDVSISSVLWGQ